LGFSYTGWPADNDIFLSVDKTAVRKPKKLIFVQISILGKIDLFNAGMIPEVGGSERSLDPPVFPVFPFGLNEHGNVLIVRKMLIRACFDQ
jgi:hypothetical protein